MTKLLRFFWIGIFSVTVTPGLFAQQQDVRAQSIMAEVAAKYRSYTSYSANVKTQLKQTDESDSKSFSGRVLYQGDKYRITLPEMDIFCDGKKIYQYLPEVKEVNVSSVSPEFKGYNVLVSSPMEFFKVYDKEFVSRFVQEETSGGMVFTDVDMVPVQQNGGDISRIRVRINKQQMQVFSMFAFLKNGLQYYIEFSQIVVNRPIMEKEFVFTPADYPGVEVIDLSF